MKSLVLFSSSMACHHGGTETYVQTLARTLSGQIPDIRLLSGGAPSNFTPDYRMLLASQGIRECHFPLFGRNSLPGRFLDGSGLGRKLCSADVEALSSLLFFPRINCFIKGADLIETHYPLEGLLFPLFPAEMAKILHFHGAWPSPLFRRLAGPILTHTDCCVACSNYAREELLKSVPSMTVEVVYNGVDLDIFSPGPSSYSPGRSYNNACLKVGTVARLSHDKGSGLLCQVAAGMKEEVELFLAGPPDLGFAAELKKITTAPNIHYLGPLDHGKIADFYRFIDCFVLPSRFEAFPLTILEAMACGTAVIATRVGGIPEMMGQDQLAGCYMSPDNDDELRMHLHRLHRDRGSLQQMGRMGRERVVRQFSLQRTTSDMLALYRKVLEMRNLQGRGRS